MRSDTLWAFDGSDLIATPDILTRGSSLRIGDDAYTTAQQTQQGEATTPPRLLHLKGASAHLIPNTDWAYDVTAFDGRAYFLRGTGGGDPAPTEVWTFDGTQATKHAALSDLVALSTGRVLLDADEDLLYVGVDSVLARFDGRTVTPIDLKGEALCSTDAFTYTSLTLIETRHFDGCELSLVRSDTLVSKWDLYNDYSSLFQAARTSGIDLGSSTRYGDDILFQSYGTLYRFANDSVSAVIDDASTLSREAFGVEHQGAFYFTSKGEVWMLTPDALLPASAPSVPNRPHTITIAPNPATGWTTVTLTLDAPDHLRIAVYDSLGRQIVILDDGPLSAATDHTFRFDTSNWPAGVYTIRAAGTASVLTQSLVVAR